MATTWFTTYSTANLWRYIYNVTGTWPRVTGITYGTFSPSSYWTWETVADLSSGPYMLVAFRNHPTLSGNHIALRYTIDGTLIRSVGNFSSGLEPTGNNHLVGMFFDTVYDENDAVLARSSMKLEMQGRAVDYCEYLYASISVS